MSGVFGVQAKLRLTGQILTPSIDAHERADLAVIVGLVGLQRLRPLGALSVFRMGTPKSDPQMAPRPLFPSANEAEFLIREFSSFPRSTVHASSRSGAYIYELADGVLGHPGLADLFFGSFTPAVATTRWRPDDQHSEFVTAVSIPSQALTSDLFIHKSLEGLETLETSMHSTLSQPFSSDLALRASSRLPIDVPPLILDDLGDGFDLPEMPSYEALVMQAFQQLGQQARDYRLVRVSLAFPPAPAVLLVRWQLPA